jgi:endonuclease YncB( thermonuclease family)
MRLAPLLAGCVALACITGMAADPPQPARVVAVIDGDTLTVLDATNTQHRGRLAGIDAPERAQPFGTKARERMAALAMGKSVAVHSQGQDKYGREIARIEFEGQDVGRQLVAEGLAWHYTRYSDDAGLAAAERDARAARRGLWADAKPVPPWEWRKTESGR